MLCISECGYKTVMVNSYLQCQSKLQFGSTKCKKIHIGKTCEEYKCQPLYVDNWEEVEKENEEKGILEIKDECQGEALMEEKEDDKYLYFQRWSQSEEYQNESEQRKRNCEENTQYSGRNTIWKAILSGCSPLEE